MMPMFYIHHTSCISPQQTFLHADISVMHQPVDNILKVIEPAYMGIAPGVLRRMSKLVRIGAGAALPLLKQPATIDGIIIGTANAGMEDCINFLKQIVDYNEGLLSPAGFVQSTPNTLAAQLGIMSGNKGYNITHVHLGLAFENSVIDAGMMIKDRPGNNYLLGAADDIASYNYTLNLLAGWYKNQSFAAGGLYEINSPGSIAGEGAAMFLVNGNPANAIACLKAVGTIHTDNEGVIAQQLKNFIAAHLPAGNTIDLLVSGENGDNRLLKYYEAIEKIIPGNAAVTRYKHISGEYPTASAFALWLACYILQKNPLPPHIIKKNLPVAACKNILIYNCFKGVQHGFMLITALPSQ